MGEENKNLKIKGTLYSGYRFSIYRSNQGVDIFAELNFTKDILEITGVFYGSYIFLKEDILSIDPYKALLPIFRKGIKINHKVKHYYPFIIFKSRGEDYYSLIKKIEETGFLDGNPCSLNTEEIGKIRQIQQDKISLSKWILILVCVAVLVIFIILYIKFNWNFLNSFLYEN